MSHTFIPNHFDFSKDLKIEIMKNEIAKYSTIGVGGLLFIIYINFEISFCFYKHLNLKSVYYYDIRHKCTYKGISRGARANSKKIISIGGQNFIHFGLSRRFIM